MEELDGRVFMLDVGVSFIQRLSFPGGTVNVLVEFRERKHYFQISMVKIPRDQMHSLWVVVLSAG